MSLELLKMAGVAVDGPPPYGRDLGDYVYLSAILEKEAGVLGSLGSGMRSLARLPGEALHSPRAHASAYRVSNALSGGDIGVGEVAQAALGEVGHRLNAPRRINLTRPANYKKTMSQSVMHPWQRGANRAAESFRASAQNVAHAATSALRAPLR